MIDYLQSASSTLFRESADKAIALQIKSCTAYYVQQIFTKFMVHQ